MSQEEKYPNPPADMGELLQWIEREWVTLREAVLALPPERLTVPGNGGWSVVDHMAHLAFWEQMLVRGYLGGEPQHEVLGVTEEEFRGLSEDAENDIVYRRNRGRDPAEVLAEVWASHDNAVEAISRFPFERLTQPRQAGDEYPLSAYVAGNTYGHYLEHAEWLKPLMGAA
ncbi:MAG: DinB family protein [Nitrososphaerales archaeon]